MVFCPASILEGFSEIEGQKNVSKLGWKHSSPKLTRVYPPTGPPVPKTLKIYQPREYFKVIFNLAGYFNLQGLFLETLQNDPLEQAQNWDF